MENAGPASPRHQKAFFAEGEEQDEEGLASLQVKRKELVEQVCIVTELVF